MSEMSDVTAAALLEETDALLQLIPRDMERSMLSPKLKDAVTAKIVEQLQTLRERVRRGKKEAGVVWHPTLGHIPADSVKGKEVSEGGDDH